MKLLQALRRSNGYTTVSDDYTNGAKDESCRKKALKKWEQRLDSQEQPRAESDLPLAPAGSNFHQTWVRPQAAIIAERKVKPERDNAQLKAMVNYLACTVPGR